MVLRRRRIHHADPIHFLRGRFFHLVRHAGLCDSGAEIFHLHRLFVPLAQLLLNLPELLPKNVFPLFFIDFSGDLLLDLLLNFLFLDLPVHEDHDLSDPFVLIHLLQDAVLLFNREGKIGSHKIRKAARIRDVHCREQQLTGEIGNQFREFLEHLTKTGHEVLHLRVLGGLFFNPCNPGLEIRFQTRVFLDRHTSKPLNQEAHPTGGQLHHFEHLGCRSLGKQAIR